MKTLISSSELARVLVSKNDFLRGEIAPREYNGMVIGDFVPEANGKTKPQIWGITQPSAKVQQQYGVKPQRFLRITPQVVDNPGGARRTDRNNVPFNVFEQSYRDLLLDIVEGLKAELNDFSEVEIRNPVTGQSVKHPAWRLPFKILGYAAKVAVPKYYLLKPGTHEKWAIRKMNPLTGQPEPDVARDRWLRIFLTTDDCDSPLETVVAEAERRVLPFLEGERESILTVAGIPVTAEHEVKATLTDQEKAENTDKLNAADLGEMPG